MNFIATLLLILSKLNPPKKSFMLYMLQCQIKRLTMTYNILLHAQSLQIL